MFYFVQELRSCLGYLSSTLLYGDPGVYGGDDKAPGRVTSPLGNSGLGFSDLELPSCVKYEPGVCFWYLADIL